MRVRTPKSMALNFQLGWKAFGSSIWRSSSISWKQGEHGYPSMEAHGRGCEHSTLVALNHGVIVVMWRHTSSVILVVNCGWAASAYFVNDQSLPRWIYKFTELRPGKISYGANYLLLSALWIIIWTWYNGRLNSRPSGLAWAPELHSRVEAPRYHTWTILKLLSGLINGGKLLYSLKTAEKK